MTGNREYKSDVFSMLLEDKENALLLYNALNDSDYTNPDDVEICTLEKGISLTVRNDASFVIDSSLNIYEHQSTVCPNMPLRSLIYVANHLEKRIKQQRLNLFGHTLVKIPTPKFIVFYNGKENQPEKYEHKLSDCFEKETDNPQLELKCIVYNINKGNNAELLNRCGFLKDYMIFIDYVRYYYDEKNLSLGDSIEYAINRCIDEDVLKDFLINRREEVAKVTNLDFTFERQIELEREEAENKGLLRGREEGMSLGRVEGISLGRMEGMEMEIFKSVQDGDYGVPRGAEKLGVTELEFIVKMENAGYKIPEFV